MQHSASDVVSLLISNFVDPPLLARILRVERDDIANWALGLEAPAPDLADAMAGLLRQLSAGADIDLVEIEWDLRFAPEPEWRETIEGWLAGPAHAPAMAGTALCA